MPSVSANARPCPLCSSDQSGQPPGPYSKNEWNVKTCTDCGTTFLENAPEYEALESDFAWEKTSAAVDEERKKKKPVAKALDRFMKFFKDKVLKRDKAGTLTRAYMPPGKVLDIGCGRGNMLVRLPGEYIPYGIEVSRQLAEISRERIKGRQGQIIQADAITGLQSLEPDFFDGALLSAFLEHEINPSTLLKELHRVLKKNATAIIKVPNFDCINRKVMGRNWCGFRYPDHVTYFTPGTLLRLITESGFTVARFNFLDRFPFSDNMWLIIRK